MESSVRTAERRSLAAYTELYRSHHPGLLRCADILTGGDRRRAEALVAEAHLRVWRRLAAGQRIEDPRACLATTVRHLAAAPVREKAVPDVPGGESGDPAAGVAETDRMRRLLAQLPERWAHALWPAEVEGLPPGGIGARLGVRRGGGAGAPGPRGAAAGLPAGLPGQPAPPVLRRALGGAGRARPRPGRTAGRAAGGAAPAALRGLPAPAGPAAPGRPGPGRAGGRRAARRPPAALLGPPAGVAGQRGGEPGCGAGHRVAAQPGAGVEA
ncbi:RNA polymerase sigma factor, partial [Kitasatospora griseola]|uniref:RNA polymerase sigma factor n=1 Tax=Kitasatospora griseola TaxID=2064 RepID=UPI00348C358A